jgi:hypothetical protein
LALIDEKQIDALRQTERARFSRWFVPTPLGMAYIDRQGRPRRVSDDELAVWQAAAYVRIEAMLAELPKNAWTAVGVIVGTAMLGPMLFSALGIGGYAQKVGVIVTGILIESGLIGLEVHDYLARWRAQRDALEAAVAGRAPLPIDPNQARIPRNWYLLGQYAIGVLLILASFGMHFDGGLDSSVNWAWVILAAPILLVLQFASKRHDRVVQQRLRQR